MTSNLNFTKWDFVFLKGVEDRYRIDNDYNES